MREIPGMKFYVDKEEPPSLEVVVREVQSTSKVRSYTMRYCITV